MKKIFFVIISIIILSIVFRLKDQFENKSLSLLSPRNTSIQPVDTEKVTILAENLDTPWAIAFLPDGGMLVTERPGRVRFIAKDGKLQKEPVAVISQVKEIGEGGLLGIVLHPNFSSNHFIYFYYTYGNTGEDTFNRVVRMKYENNTL